MSFKIIPNISTIFIDLPMLERMAAAKKCGFGEIEMQFPYEAGTIEAWQQAQKASGGIKVVLMNMYPGNLKEGELGCACHPDAADKFLKNLAKSIEYCNALGCKRLHVIAGKRLSGGRDYSKEFKEEEMLNAYVSNLRIAASVLEEQGIECVIEPINSVQAVPHYFLNHPDLAMSVLEKVGHKNLKIQFDFFHFQTVTGNLTAYFKRLLPYIGHVQLAQVPNRDEPDHPGEINYRYAFEMMRSFGYSGRVGCEYNQKRPASGENSTFSWIHEYGLEKAE